VARLERLDDPADPRLRDFTDLRDVALRSRREPAEGLFIAEGEATIRRAVAAGFRLRSVLLTERWLEGLADLLETTGATGYVVPASVLDATTGFPVHRGALASMERRALPEAASLLSRAAFVVVLEDLTDPTNLGAVFRSAAALGVDAVLLTPRCADPLYRRAVRTSMGAVFSVPWGRLPWFEGPDVLHAAGFGVAALTPGADAVPVRAVNRATYPRLALALGTEGPGLSPRWLGAADLRVRIPMRAGVDSLNVAAAAAVACYALATPAES
jgi:tRNA G18 (ribose-2'-O)-methylase SpoU